MFVTVDGPIGNSNRFSESLANGDNERRLTRTSGTEIWSRLYEGAVKAKPELFKITFHIYW